MRALAIWSGRGGQPGMRRVDGEEGVEWAGEVVGGAEQVVAEGAVAEGGDEARFGHRLIRGQEWCVHAGCDGAGDEEDVGVAG